VTIILPLVEHVLPIRSPVRLCPACLSLRKQQTQHRTTLRRVVPDRPHTDRLVIAMSAATHSIKPQASTAPLRAISAWVLAAKGKGNPHAHSNNMHTQLKGHLAPRNHTQSINCQQHLTANSCADGSGAGAVISAAQAPTTAHTPTAADSSSAV
jgi:hypothetical protein